LSGPARRLAAVAVGSIALAACSLVSASFEWREVTVAGQTQCLPVAFTLAAQERGLQGVKHVARPMVFAYSPPDTPSFWMKDTPSPLTGVWIGAQGRVIGYWHGKPQSTELHHPSAPVAAVIEYRAGSRVPPTGARFALGRRCAAQRGGL
jgi:uncharacterized membrane protein (UPF0127 family)